MATIRERRKDDGGKSYQAIVRLKGYPPQSSTFSRKTDAKKWATQTEAAIRENRYFKTAEAQKHTLREMLEKYIEDVLPQKPKSYTTQKGQLQWWIKELGDYSLAELSTSDIAEKRDELISGGRSPSTAKRYLAALSHAFTIAVTDWEWLQESPVKNVKKPKEPRGRDRFLSDDERERLFTACQKSKEESLYPIVLLAISTGMRQGEILNMEWSDVDFQRNRIVIKETKNGTSRSIPLAGAAYEELRKRSKVRTLGVNLVFPGSIPDKPIVFRKHWLKALTEAEVEDFRFHDLRHTAASYLAMSGASLLEISNVLGHKTLAMVLRYSHLTEQHSAGVVAKMNDSILGDQVNVPK